MACKAPAHEIARYIQIVNACFRDAMTEKDVLAGPLQEVLDELVELHNTVSHASIFGSSVKRSTAATAAALYALMPALRRRMDCRQRDYILSHSLQRGYAHTLSLLLSVCLRDALLPLVSQLFSLGTSGYAVPLTVR
jgi:hypothetical protein